MRGEDVIQIAVPTIYYRQVIGTITEGIEILMSALVKVVIQPAPVYWQP